MLIARTRRDPTADVDPDGPPTFVTDDSALVGRLADLRPRPSASPRRSAAREDGKLRLDEDGLLPRRPRGSTST